MKIVNLKNEKRGRGVASCHPGTVVQFNKKFHENYPPNSLYIVLDICGAYAHPEPGFARTKHGVANLSTGKLSFVSGSREVTIMDAQVKVNGPA